MLGHACYSFSGNGFPRSIEEIKEYLTRLRTFCRSTCDPDGRVYHTLVLCRSVQVQLPHSLAMRLRVRHHQLRR